MPKLSIEELAKTLIDSTFGLTGRKISAWDKCAQKWGKDLRKGLYDPKNQAFLSGKTSLSVKKTKLPNKEAPTFNNQCFLKLQ